MRIADLLLRELDNEAKSTLAMLQRVPADRLDWTPHDKSMSLGRLAWHLASIPRVPGRIFGAGGFDVATARPAPGSDEMRDFLAEFERSLAVARETVTTLDDEALFEKVELRRGGAVLTSMPKYFILRTILLNHIVHHRGQLSVYLRLLDVPLPATYGTSADETMGG